MADDMVSPAQSNKARTRSAARLASVQALYQMELSGHDANDVIREFLIHRLGEEGDHQGRQDTDLEHFADVTRGVVAAQVRIDRLVEEALAEGWHLDRLDSTVRALLRSAAFELLHCPDIPARVVINEYVDIAHAFFEGSEPAFVNGVLDHIARKVRAPEFAAAADLRRGPAPDQA